MKQIIIASAWHIGEIATYMLKEVRKGEPVMCRFQGDYTIMMFPDHNENKRFPSRLIEEIYPEWEDRPEVQRF